MTTPPEGSGPEDPTRAQPRIIRIGDDSEAPFLPGVEPSENPEPATRPAAGSGGPSTRLLVAGGIVIALVLGLLGGAVWGLSGRNSAATSIPPSTSPTLPSLSPSASTPTPSSTPTPTPTPTGPTPTPTVPGGFPAAPASTMLTSQQWQVSRWQITNTGGTIGLIATLTNQAATVRSGKLTIYAYVGGKPLAIMTASVTNAPSNVAATVNFVSTDKWGPGSKTLLLVAS